MKKLKILMIGEHPLIESGFSSQFRGILSSLHKAGHEVHACCWVLGGYGTEFIDFNPDVELDYEGKPINNKNELPYKTYPLTSQSGMDIDYWGIKNKKLQAYIQNIKPEVIFAYGDPHMLNERGLNVYNLSRLFGIPLVTYVAIDCAGHQEWVGQNLLNTEFPVVFTNWAREQLNTEFPFLGDHVRTIYHGVKEAQLIHKDRKDFLKNQFEFPVKGEKRRLNKNDKIFLTVARNCERKGFDSLLKAYKLLREKRQDFIVILHTQPRDFAIDSVDLDYKVRIEYGMSDYVFFSNIPNPAVTHGINKVVPWEYMENLYGIADVHVLPSKREGVGLPVLEAAMVGIPSIVTDYAGLSELCKEERGWTIPLVEEPYSYQSDNQWAHRDGIIDINKLVETMDYVLYNPKERNERALNMRRWILENWNWETVGQQWVNLFDEVTTYLESRHLKVLGDIPRHTFATYYADFKHPHNAKTLVALNTINTLENLGYKIEKQDITLLNNPNDAYQRNNNCIVHGLSDLIFGKKLDYELAMELLEKKHKRIFLYEQADTSSIDSTFTEFLNNKIITGILTPSEYSKMVLHNSGVTKKVYVVSHGVRVFESSNKFDFLSKQYPKMKKVLMFSKEFHKRKGLEPMLRSCSTYGFIPNNVNSKSNIVVLLRTDDENLDIQGANFPIHKINEWLSPNDLASLYNNSDIFISLHRSGAFELCPLEALSYGVPSIITGFGSALEYAPKETLIEPITFEQIHLDVDPNNGDGVNCDLNQVMARMKYIFQNEENEINKAKEYAQEIKDKFTWEASVYKIVEALEK